MQAAQVVIVTPALAAANNGNWQTAQRWARLLRPACSVQVLQQWTGGQQQLMVALHARRSAASMLAWRHTQQAQQKRPLLLVLTGTDLYRDIQHDGLAQQALQLADALVVLNELGARSLPAALQGKAHVLLQSCSSLATLHKTTRHLRAVAVGHLRDEKDPRTAWRALQRLAGRPDIRLDHIGSALQPALGDEAAALAASSPQFRWLGGLPHAATRRSIQAAHVLVHTSRMEGGAQVLTEALCSGTPVLASRIDGNVGVLGSGYGGLFEPGDDAALARLLLHARDDASFLPGLAAQLAPRRALFAPAVERAALLQLVGGLLAQHAAVSSGPALPA